MNAILSAFSHDHMIYNFSTIDTYLLADPSRKILSLVTHPLAIQVLTMGYTLYIGQQCAASLRRNSADVKYAYLDYLFSSFGKDENFLLRSL